MLLSQVCVFQDKLIILSWSSVEKTWEFRNKHKKIGKRKKAKRGWKEAAVKEEEGKKTLKSWSENDCLQRNWNFVAVEYKKDIRNPLSEVLSQKEWYYIHIDSLKAIILGRKVHFLQLLVKGGCMWQKGQDGQVCPFSACLIVLAGSCVLTLFIC